MDVVNAINNLANAELFGIIGGFAIVALALLANIPIGDDRLTNGSAHWYVGLAYFGVGALFSVFGIILRVIFNVVTASYLNVELIPIVGSIVTGFLLIVIIFMSISGIGCVIPFLLKRDFGPLLRGLVRITDKLNNLILDCVLPARAHGEVAPVQIAAAGIQMERHSYDELTQLLKESDRNSLFYFQFGLGFAGEAAALTLTLTIQTLSAQKTDLGFDLTLPTIIIGLLGLLVMFYSSIQYARGLPGPFIVILKALSILGASFVPGSVIVFLLTLKPFWIQAGLIGWMITVCLIISMILAAKSHQIQGR